MEGGEGVEALDATDGLALGSADASDPDAVAGEVIGVDSVHLVGADLFLRDADTARGFDAGDGGLEGGAGDPERGGHLPAALVLYDAREAGGAPGGHPKRR